MKECRKQRVPTGDRTRPRARLAILDRNVVGELREGVVEHRRCAGGDDAVTHFEKRLEAMDGKAMIVCMSRRIAVDLYNALVEQAMTSMPSRAGRAW